MNKTFPEIGENFSLTTNYSHSHKSPKAPAKYTLALDSWGPQNISCRKLLRMN